jgi:hypothetical protein
MSAKIAIFGYVAWLMRLAYHYFFCPECSPDRGANR